MFMGTLQTPYLEKMIGSISLVFSDLILIGERIEINMKNEKILGAIGTMSEIKKPYSNFHKKKEGERNAIAVSGRPSHPL